MTTADALTGQTIDSYLIVRHLARGGMADVYVAHDQSLDRDAILKVLLPSFVENEGFVQRFRREAQAMARLEHPNIVQVYGTGATADGRPYIAMQYVRGGTLEEKLADLAAHGQVMTTEYALAIARQVSAALQTAHEAGIVHRDLKPSNILLDEKEKPLLTDLGIAFVLNDARLTRTDVFLGTPHYMSPEQAQGHQPDARSDVYAMGVVIYEMLAGRRPFDGESHFALIHQHVSEPPPPLKMVRPNLSKTTYQVVDKSLEKDPARRYQSAAELVFALDRALAAEGIAISMTPSGQWSWQANSGSLASSRTGVVNTTVNFDPRKKRGLMPIAAGTMILLVFLLAGFWLWPRIVRGGADTETSTPIPVVIVETTIVTPTADPDQGPTSTLIPVTTVVEKVVTATLKPTVTPRPSSTPIRAATVTKSSGANPARANADVLTREGPGLNFPIAVALVLDETITLVERDNQGIWYHVQTANGRKGWITANFINAPVELLSAVPVAIELPSLPTPTPVPEITVVPLTAAPTSVSGPTQPTAVQPTQPTAVQPTVETPTDVPEPTPTLNIYP